VETTQLSIKLIQKHCTSILMQSRCAEFPFHDLEHTKEVIANIKFLGKQLKVSKKELFILEIAAWFHDIGFSETYKEHKDVSKKIATVFLISYELEQTTIEAILDCIEATKMSQSPESNLAKILCDADLFHIATPDFFYRKLLLRREWEIFCDIKSSDLERHQLNLAFLKNDIFCTFYGKDILEVQKKENLKKVSRILNYY